MKYSFGISIFPEESSSLSHSVVFLYFLALITEEALLVSLATLWSSPFVVSVCPSTPPACGPHFPRSRYLLSNRGPETLFIYSAIKYVYEWLSMCIGFARWLCGTESSCQADLVWSLGREFSKGEGNGKPLQYSCLGNSVARGSWQATVHGLQRVGYNCVTDTFILTFLSARQSS